MKEPRCKTAAPRQVGQERGGELPWGHGGGSLRPSGKPWPAAGHLAAPWCEWCVLSAHCARSLANWVNRGWPPLATSRDWGGDKQLCSVSVPMPSGFHLLWGPYLGKGQGQSLTAAEEEEG